MRGQDEQQLGVFSYVNSEQRIPHDHPLRQLRAMADEALRELKPRFSRLYAKTGRPSIAPGEVVACVAAPSVVLRAQRTDADGATRLQLVVPLVCGTEHGRSDLECDGVHEDAFFAAVLKQARSRDLLSDEHFTVDGTLLEAWAGQKSFRRVDDNHQLPTTGTGEGSNPTVNFHREKRGNQTHCSTTDPDAMLSRKSRGSGAVLAYRGHLLTLLAAQTSAQCRCLRLRWHTECEREVLTEEGLP